MTLFKQLMALAALGASAGLMTGCGSEERAQIAAAIFPGAHASTPAAAAAEIRRKRRGEPPQAAAAAAAASAAASTR